MSILIRLKLRNNFESKAREFRYNELNQYAIKNNITGIICDGNDISSIYESIKNLIKDKKYVNYGDAAKEFSKNFYWNKIVKQYLKLMTSIKVTFIMKTLILWANHLTMNICLYVLR